MLNLWIKISLVTTAARKCLSRLCDLFHFLLYRRRLSENTVWLLRIQRSREISIINPWTYACDFAQQYFLSYFKSAKGKREREKGREQRVMQNPQHLSMKPLRITAASIRREIFNLAQPSDNHRAAPSTNLLKPSLTIPDWPARIFLFPITPVTLRIFTHRYLSSRIINVIDKYFLCREDRLFVTMLLSNCYYSKHERLPICVWRTCHPILTSHNAYLIYYIQSLLFLLTCFRQLIMF